MLQRPISLVIKPYDVRETTVNVSDFAGDAACQW